jgi:hypothetical protein
MPGKRHKSRRALRLARNLDPLPQQAISDQQLLHTLGAITPRCFDTPHPLTAAVSRECASAGPAPTLASERVVS